MIHILKHSRYDGYFEKMAERIKAVLTEETRKAILRLKYETPDTEYCMGVEYYQAVLRDGVRTYAEFENWRRQHPVTGIVEWDALILSVFPLYRTYKSFSRADQAFPSFRLSCFHTAGYYVPL